MIKKAVLFRIITPVISIVVLLALLEFFARLYQSEFSPPHDHYSFRKTCPAPYKNAPYFSEKFIWESFHQPSQWIHPKGTRLIIPGDYRGTYFNIKNGLRATTSQPQNFDHTVYLFGGSTVYDSEVPDNLTIASQLQSLFNSRYNSEFIVQNYGTTTVTIAQELERLKRIQTKPGDIVVFYDGVNDIYQGLFYANPDETMIERNRRAVRDVDPLRRIQLSAYNRWSEQSSFIQIFFDPINRSFPAHLNDPNLLKDLLSSLGRRYKETLEDASAYVMKSHANFYHFLQPHLFADTTLSLYEKKLSQNSFIVPKGIKESFQNGYPILKSEIGKLPDRNSRFDLTAVLNERKNGNEYFFDACHVNHEANKIIATKIFEQLDKDLRNSSRN